MKTISCLSLILLISSSVCADNQECQKKITAKLVFDVNNTLTSVVETDPSKNAIPVGCEKTLEILEKRLNKIADGAFNTLDISHLLIENGYRELILTENAFRGLKNLKSLTINTRIQSSDYEKLFAPISHLEQLWLSIGENKNLLKVALSMCKKLESLAVFDVRSWTIDHTTFADASQSLTNLTFLASGITGIEANSFSSLKKLRNLEFSSGSLSGIRKGAFDHLKLKSLEFSFNRPLIINAGTFTELNVENLSLIANGKHVMIEDGALVNLKIKKLYIHETLLKQTTKWGISKTTPTWSQS